MAAEGKSYANVTLTSLNGDLSVVIFLPKGVLSNEDSDVFYYSSRFDHGSMIGQITRKRRFFVNNTLNQQARTQLQKGQQTGSYNTTMGSHPDALLEERQHVLFGTDAWRQPHNTHWPESGVGLASEFGVGDDGSFCNYRCGWYQENDVTNGVLGYQEAGQNEPFLKIGVGELLKGTCPMCDSTDDYKFNSPYLFASQPTWNMTILDTKTVPTTTLTTSSGNALPTTTTEIRSIKLDHEAMLRNKKFGYGLSKTISLNGRVLEVTTTLTNHGIAPFSTVWYSHNLFSCDHTAVGPGYSIDLNIEGTGHTVGGPGTISHVGIPITDILGGQTYVTSVSSGINGMSPLSLSSSLPISATPNNGIGPLSPLLPPLYEEPGTWSWATPLLNFASVSTYPNSVNVEMKRALDPGIRIKSEFTKDTNTDGGFTFNACQTSIQSSIHTPLLGSDGTLVMGKIGSDPNLRMYAYNLYVERGTLSPEPQILIRNLQPNQSATWTQRLVISDIVQDNEYVVDYDTTVPTNVDQNNHYAAHTTKAIVDSSHLIRTASSSLRSNTLWNRFSITEGNGSRYESASAFNETRLSVTAVMIVFAGLIILAATKIKHSVTWYRRRSLGYSPIDDHFNQQHLQHQ